MSDSGKSLLVVKADERLSPERREYLLQALKPVADSLNLVPLIAESGLDVGIHSDIKPLIEKQIGIQKQTNHLLMMLIDALSEDDELDEEGEPLTYLDGTPV